jgi:hypothetical protein
MDYRYTPSGENYAAYAAGSVFYAAPGHTAFPVRLAVEIYRRCLAIRAAQGFTAPAVVYDPCCGGAYHLATMTFFNWEKIAAIHASDIDGDALGIAARNLSLLTVEGMDRRIAQLAELHRQHGKASHAASLEYARTFRERLAICSANHPLVTHLFRADATNPAAIARGLNGIKADIVLADVPYGLGAAWHTDTSVLVQGADPVQGLLEALRPNLAAGAIVALAAAKRTNLAHAGYDQMTKLSAGPRKLVLLCCRTCV